MKCTANPARNRRLWLGLGCAAAAALAIRTIQLGQRPMHTDEAVNAVIVGGMLSGQPYRYDPHDHHGPAFFFAEEAFARGLGVRTLARLQAWQLRAVAALASAAMVPALGLFAGEEAAGLLAASLFLALGAPFVFYGRYAIHESLFVLASLVAMGAAWRFWRSSRLAWAALAGVAAGLAVATKESAAASFAAALGSLALCLLHAPSRRLWNAHRAPGLTAARARAGALAAAVIAAALAFLLYSSMGKNPGGPRDALRAFSFLSARVVRGAGHQKPWWTYAAWLVRPSPLSLPWFGWLAAASWCVGAFRSFCPGSRNPLGRFFAIFSVLLAALYAAMPYKTPWLMLNFLAPAAIVAGCGLAFVTRCLGRASHPAIAGAAICAVALLLARETQRLGFQYTDNPRNPYSYSPTSPDIERLMSRIDSIASRSAAGRGGVIQVVADDYWPLPWYLRKFPRVGYWNFVPQHLFGEVILASPDEAGRVEAMLGPGWRREYFGLRADVLVLLYSRDRPPHD